jgi:glycosyltransferase involved in cell wall biosynthesis
MPESGKSRRSVLQVGTHDPTFGRIALIAEGLRRHGFAVQECVEPTWGSTAARVRAARQGLLNPRLMWRLIRAYASLARRLRSQAQSQPLLIGYPGQLDTVVLRLFLPRAIIVLDGFVALDETLADRRLSRSGSPTRRTARAIDRLAFRMATVNVVDTHAHARRFAAEYGLDLSRTVVVPVGAQEPGALLAPTPSDTLRVLYFGGFVPLHGVPIILEAARRLTPSDRIGIHLVGDGQDADAAAARLAAEPLPHVRMLRSWMPESKLIEQHIQEADVCLGIFSDGPKAMDVVPAKVYLALACGRAVVTADSPAVREEILQRADPADPPLLTCRPADADDLAAALKRLRDDAELRARVARSGRRLFEEHFTAERIVAPLAQRLSL